MGWERARSFASVDHQVSDGCTSKFDFVCLNGLHDQFLSAYWAEQKQLCPNFNKVKNLRRSLTTNIMELFEYLIYPNENLKQQRHVYWSLFKPVFSNLSLKYKENNIYILQLAELIQISIIDSCFTLWLFVCEK